MKIDFSTCDTDIPSERGDVEHKVSRNGHMFIHRMIDSEADWNQERTEGITKADFRFPNTGTYEANPALHDELGLVVHARNGPPILALDREPKEKIVACASILG
jgi:hypothetical protein